MRLSLALLGLALLTAPVQRAAAEAAPRGPSPFEGPANTGPTTAIDRFIAAKLEKQHIPSANVCSDAVFMRRVYLDLLGMLPPPQDVKAFLNDRNPGKRSLLIDRLLQQGDMAHYWTMKWCDMLRVKAEFPINLWPNGTQAYYRFIYTAVRDNMPYDRFARELLTASGSNFRVGQVNFYRAMQNKEPTGIAQAVALTFMGMRAENWPKERLDGMAVFFQKVGFKGTAEWKEEIIFFDQTKGPPLVDEKGRALVGSFPDGTFVNLAPDRDPREVFADWLITPKNPYFTRNIANRMWCWLIGRGIIHEPDDVRPDNPPVNPELLAYLEKELISHNYDLRSLIRTIMNSRTYQLSTVARHRGAEAEANFAYYPLRRVEAEVLADALCDITSTSEKYTSAIPEPFTFVPDDTRSICLQDGSITSSFLELFGRPSRDTGLESERNGRPSAAQRLHMLNSSHVQKKIENSPKLRAIAASKGNPREQVDEIYLLVLSRYPTDEEVRIAEAYPQTSGVKGREWINDLAWALINGAEFQYKH